MISGLIRTNGRIHRTGLVVITLAVGALWCAAPLMADSFTGTGTAINATEGTIVSNAVVAGFSLLGSTDPAVDFTATIAWGDGTTSTANVVGSSGTYEVLGAHVYTDEGIYTTTTTLTHTSDSQQATATGSANVAEGDVLSGTGLTLQTTQNNIFSGTVATFSDVNIFAPPTDFTATIVWGDGTSTAGTVTGGSGAFSILGTHTYLTANNFPVDVILSDDTPGTATATAVSQADVSAVPEPGTLSLLYCGLLFLTVAASRRNQAHAN